MQDIQTWVLLIVAATAGSLFSLIGGMLLLSKRISVDTVQRIAIPFAAGAMLSVALLDLLPESIEASSSLSLTMVAVLTGFVLFFILERFLSWFHHHHEHGVHTKKRRNIRSLVVTGDVIHNAIDGMVIGAAFLADPFLGLVTTVAIAAHEIPQEIGDFGVLLALGMRRRNVLLVNIVSALVTVLVAALVFGFGGLFAPIEPFILALTAGMFLYIAASDLVPTIHAEPSTRVANYQTFVFIFGIVVIGVVSSVIHQLVPSDESTARDETVTSVIG